MKTERRLLPEYEEHLLGLPYPVVVRNAAVAKVDPGTDEVLAVAVPDTEGLAAAVAVARCLLPVQLAPEEIRFLRRVLGLKSKEMAEAIGTDPSTYSRWEGGQQGPGEYVERVLRLHVCAALAERVPAVNYDPRMITGLKVRRRMPDEPWPRIEVVRVRLKDGTTRRVSEEWDTSPLAA